MGKGDRKSRRGKINSGSYGNTRPRKSGAKPLMPSSELVKEKPSKAKATKKVEEAEVPKIKVAAKPKTPKKTTETKADKAGEETT